MKTDQKEFADLNFENRHKALLINVAEDLGDVLHRGNEYELFQLCVTLKYLITHAVNQFAEHNSKPAQ